MIYYKSKPYEPFNCSDDRHLWRPISDITKSQAEWQWTCANCNVVVNKAPIPQTAINLRELEVMVDTSLKVADKVIHDDQSVKGELWLMRSAMWHYWPYIFHIVYHIVSGNPFVILFKYVEPSTSSWFTINDTDTYGRLLDCADRERSIKGPSIRSLARTL